MIASFGLEGVGYKVVLTFKNRIPVSACRNRENKLAEIKNTYGIPLISCSIEIMY
jgi:hypothetical protein